MLFWTLYRDVSSDTRPMPSRDWTNAGMVALGIAGEKIYHYAPQTLEDSLKTVAIRSLTDKKEKYQKYRLLATVDNNLSTIK